MPTPSTRHVLLLRGVNVGTKNSLPMAELRAMLASLGCTDVATYVQSGNAVLATTLPTDELTARIEAALGRYMGRPIATTLRTEADLRRVVERNPFPELVSQPSLLCVTFLSRTPTAPELAPLYGADFGEERFHVAGAEIYTWHPGGQGRSALAAALGKLRLPGAVTTRNWSTVTKLLEMLGAHSS
ncbi:MAG: DUF1697 domain-containing protein [Myxococcota bacterium]